MWKFKEIEAGIPERNPHETEFFRLTNPSEAVVREFIQNALDARVTNVKVKMRFGEVNRQNAFQFLDALERHLSACGFHQLENLDNISYLTIEDSGTSGLDGEIRRSDSNFYNFWWREGISVKSGRLAGRWGLGKTTFHIASKIRSFWGATLRIDDRQQLLMGKTLLKTHTIGNEVYNYAGYYAGYNWEPVNDIDIIDKFKENFHVARNTEAGLSIVIPLPDEEITYDNVLRAVIKHYFYAILAGMLKVNIEEQSRKMALDKENFISTALSLNWNGTDWENVDLNEMMNFVKSSIENTNPLELNISDLSSPEVTDDSFSNLEELKERFRRGENCHFNVPVIIRDSRGLVNRSFYKVHLRKVPGLNKALEFYVRSGILISEIKTLGSRPVIGLLTAEEEPVARFLGDCETPAHTDWNERTEDFKDKYVNAARTLRFIRKSVSRIVSILDEPPRERQSDFLKEIFSMPVAREEREEGKEVKPPPTPPPPPPKEPLFNISRVSGGFKVTLNPRSSNVSFPLRAIVKIAYDTRRGNPFTQYEPFDFNVNSGSITVTPQDCNIVSRNLNELRIEITVPNFRLEVIGFDPARDLVVNVREERV